MASYTLNTTVAEETIVSRARTEANAAGAGYANNGAYLLAILKAKMLDVWHDQKQADILAFQAKWPDATREQKDQIAVILGLPAGSIP